MLISQPYRSTVKRSTMTFKDIYDFVNNGGKAVVYNLVKNAGGFKQAQFMSDYTIYQDVVYAAKIEQYDDSMLHMFGWPSVSKDIVLFDNDNNEIARGAMTDTHTRHVFFTRDDVLAELRRLMEKEAESWKKSVLGANY